NLLRRVPKHTRPGTLPGLPVHDYVPYQGLEVSRPAALVSQSGVLIEQVPGVANGATLPGPRARFYQLDQARLQLEHCFLSRVALTLHDNGDWILSLRADQNPWMTGPRTVVSTPEQERGAVSALQPPIADTGRQTSQLRRNLFIVAVRAYGAYPLKERQPEA